MDSNRFNRAMKGYVVRALSDIEYSQEEKRLKKKEEKRLKGKENLGFLVRRVILVDAEHNRLSGVSGIYLSDDCQNIEDFSPAPGRYSLEYLERPDVGKVIELSVEDVKQVITFRRFLNSDESIIEEVYEICLESYVFSGTEDAFKIEFEILEGMYYGIPF